ncbi:NPB protein, partial [Paradoxornis webbianus]|nr:NPB protein [Sinosuthora webbiana]
VRAARRLGLALPVLCRPAEPRYLPTARPRRRSVGRTSGLLSGPCRPPHTRRSGTDGSAEPDLAVLLPSSAHPPSGLRTAVLCVTGVAVELAGARGALRCKADMTMSLYPVECA